MNICIDGLGACYLKGTGLYTYTFELLSNLFELYPQPNYKILWDSNSFIPPWKDLKNVTYTNLKLDRANNNYYLLENYVTENKIDIYHSPNNGLSIPDNKVCKFIMTVHDILPALKEEYLDDKYKEKFIKMFPNSIQSSYKVIAVSEHLKGQIIDKFRIDGNKIKVIYPGCSGQFAPIKKSITKDVLKSKYDIHGDYILYAGSIHIRKNFNMLLGAYKRVAILKKDIKLVIAGKCSGKRLKYCLKLKDICKSMGISDNVIFIDTVDYKDMPFFYNGSLCSVNLSSYEGFPMTTVEAMACGTPAVCLRTSFFREIVGDGGILVKDEDELKDEFMEIIKGTSYRNKVIDRGLKQSKRYTWDKYVKDLVKIYESAVYGE